MALKEQDIVFTTTDESGNTVIQMPITRAGNIEDVMSVGQGGTGAETASGARTNLGLATAVTGASISGQVITLSKADGTKTTLTTQDTTGCHTGNATAIGGASTTKPAVVVTTYKSGTNWYRVWSDGTLEQGGVATRTGTITFLKAFKDTNYCPFLQCWQSGASEDYTGNINGATTTSFTYLCAGSVSSFSWYAIGTNAS